MPIKSLTPYLFFNGDAEKAIKLYETALGAKTEHLQRFGETPGADVSAEAKNRIIHAMLWIDKSPLMLSDSDGRTPVPTGGNVSVTIDFDDVGEMTRKFEALAKGGKVTMALQDTFWGAKFGTLTDQFGIQWMFNCTLRK
jgi:PhnB protein